MNINLKSKVKNLSIFQLRKKKFEKFARWVKNFSRKYYHIHHDYDDALHPKILHILKVKYKKEDAWEINIVAINYKTFVAVFCFDLKNLVLKCYFSTIYFYFFGIRLFEIILIWNIVYWKWITEVSIIV